jgi:hypothetical protein
MLTVKGLDSATNTEVCLYSCTLLSDAIRWAHGYTRRDNGGYDTIIVNDASGATVYTIPSAPADTNF